MINNSQIYAAVPSSLQPIHKKGIQTIILKLLYSTVSPKYAGPNLISDDASGIVIRLRLKFVKTNIKGYQ